MALRADLRRAGWKQATRHRAAHSRVGTRSVSNLRRCVALYLSHLQSGQLHLQRSTPVLPRLSSENSYEYYRSMSVRFCIAWILLATTPAPAETITVSPQTTDQPTGDMIEGSLVALDEEQY